MFAQLRPRSDFFDMKMRFGERLCMNMGRLARSNAGNEANVVPAAFEGSTLSWPLDPEPSTTRRQRPTPPQRRGVHPHTNSKGGRRKGGAGGDARPPLKRLWAAQEAPAPDAKRAARMVGWEQHMLPPDLEAGPRRRAHIRGAPHDTSPRNIVACAASTISSRPAGAAYMGTGQAARDRAAWPAMPSSTPQRR